MAVCYSMIIDRRGVFRRVNLLLANKLVGVSEEDDNEMVSRREVR